MSVVGNDTRELNMPIDRGVTACERGASIWDKAAAIQSAPIEAGGSASVWPAAASAAVDLEFDIVFFVTS